MKIDPEQIEHASSITERVSSETQGVGYETIEGWTGIDQLDRLDTTHALVLRRGEGNVQNLESLALP